MKNLKIGIIGMGSTGLGAAQHLVDLSAQSKIIQDSIEIHFFDPTNEMHGAGGQVKSYHDIETKLTSELGAVIIFPSWKKINNLLNRYNIKTKTAPLAMQRFVIGGSNAPNLIPSRNNFAFILQLNNYRKLCARADYKRFFEQGNHEAPAELLTTTQEWAHKNNIQLIVGMFQEFYSGCGYGQNIWEQPAIYVVQLMTFDVVLELVKNAFNLHKVKSVVGGYQKLWTTIAENLRKNSNCHFHYGEEVLLVTQKYNNLNENVYNISTAGMSIDVDKVIFTNSPYNITKIFKSSYKDQEFDLLINTLQQSTCMNYQVVIAQVTYQNAIRFNKPSTRFFYESYRSRSDKKYAPVLDITMDGESAVDRANSKINHMLYFYGNRGDANMTPDMVQNNLKEYNGVVNKIQHVENWDNYHQHFPIPTLQAGAAKILHTYNQTHGAQIVGSITAMGFTEATVNQGALAAQRIFNEHTLRCSQL